jgi:archaellum component FlaF (FlaF/FlaG flagellin family)
VGRGFSAVLALVVTCSALAGVGFVAGTTPLNAAITDVTVTPDPAVPGERLVAEVTVENFATSNEAYRIDAVAIRNAGGRLDELSRVEDPGVISPGGSLTVPFGLRFRDPGEKTFRVVVYGEGQQSEDDLQLTYPLRVTVTDATPKVEVDLRRPVAGVTSNATVTLANGVERELRNVEVRLDGDVTVERPRRVRSTLTAGETATFGFEVTPEMAGETDLDATVEYTLAGGPTRTVNASATVRTRELDDRVRLRANVSSGQVFVTATNLGNVAVEKLVLDASGDGASVGERVVSTLASGESHTVALPVESLDAADGVATVTVDGTYEVADQRRAVDGGDVTLRRAVALNATTAADGGVSVQVSNLGSVTVERVVVRGSTPDATVGQAVVPTLPPGESATVTLPVSGLRRSADVSVTGQYEVGATTASAAGDEVRVERVPGRVELTGVDIGTEDGTTTISGSVSNVGLADVDAVVVRVVPDDGVTPVAPNREYFVGTVPASDFVSFDVTARLAPNTTSVPLNVSYVADGERRSQTVMVPLDAARTPEPSGSGGGTGGLLLPAVGGVLVVVVVAAFVVVAWRNRRAGD